MRSSGWPSTRDRPVDPRARELRIRRGRRAQERVDIAISTLHGRTAERILLVSSIDMAEARDRELIRRVRGGDQDAFRGLFARYAPSAKALALRVVRQSNLAEEIVQEAFLALWRNPDAYDQQRGSVKAWLMGMVHHRAVDLVRREESQRRRAQQAGQDVIQIVDDPAAQVVQ